MEQAVVRGLGGRRIEEPSLKQFLLELRIVESCPIIHEHTLVLEFNRVLDHFVVKTCHVPAFPYSPAYCSKAKGVDFSTLWQPILDPSTLICFRLKGFLFDMLKTKGKACMKHSMACKI